jgi:hypothetical protein
VTCFGSPRPRMLIERVPLKSPGEGSWTLAGSLAGPPKPQMWIRALHVAILTLAIAQFPRRHRQGPALRPQALSPQVILLAWAAMGSVETRTTPWTRTRDMDEWSKPEDPLDSRDQGRPRREIPGESPTLQA